MPITKRTGDWKSLRAEFGLTPKDEIDLHFGANLCPVCLVYPVSIHTTVFLAQGLTVLQRIHSQTLASPRRCRAAHSSRITR